MINKKSPRKNISVNENPKNEGNYFSSIAGKYKKVSKLIYILLAAAFALTLIFNSQLLTYTNFNYLFRDLNTAAESAGDNYNSISYANDTLRAVEKFRGGIITVSSNDIAIYTATGRRTFYKSESFVSPKLVTSKKYAIAYELGGKKYNVYNSFSKVGGETLKYPISYATVADNGYFAIVSKDAEYTSVVYLYNDDLSLVNKYKFATSMVFSVDLSDDGEKIVIFKTETEIDKFSTSVLLCEVGKENSTFDIKISSGIVCGGGFTSDGNIQLVTTDGYYLISSSDGEIISYTAFDSSVNKVSLTRYGCAVSLLNDLGKVENKVIVFDENGKTICTMTVNGGIVDMEYFEGYVFLNQRDHISKINIKNNAVESLSISDNGNDIIVYDSKNILLCCQTKAKYIKI